MLKAAPFGECPRTLYRPRLSVSRLRDKQAWGDTAGVVLVAAGAAVVPVVLLG